MTELETASLAGTALARLRSVWSEALELTGEWREDATFFELGGYSLLALAVADRVGAELGVAAPRTLVFDHPTFQAMVDWASTQEYGRQDAAGPKTTVADDVPATAAFPMSPLQHAYLLGETGAFELTSPALFLEEYRCAEFDVDSFGRALLTLIERHEMLRAAFDPEGSQRAMPAPARPPVEVRDLSAWTDPATEAELERSRVELVAAPPAADGGTVVVFRVFRLHTSFHIQVCGRLLVFDGRSGDIFASELRALLAGEQLPDIDYTYREYRLAVDRQRSDEYGAARRYWLDRLPDLPAAPDLPYRRSMTAGSMRRRALVLDEPRWSAFKAAARTHNVTTTAALCAVFCEVLRHFSAAAAFTLNVMYGERRPMHPGVSGVVGNFSDTLLLECRGGADTFAGRARALGAQLVADLTHGAFSGVEVVRELNRQWGQWQGAAMPVVFASVVGGESQDGIFLERLGWERLSGEIHTPQVCLDHQVFDSRNRLVANWDSIDESFPAGFLDAMFDAYRGLLTRLCAEPQAWHATAFPLTPPEQLAVRERVNDTRTPMPLRTLHEPVFAQAERTPDAVAVVAPDGQLTYREFTRRASRVAAALAHAGCRPGELVAVYQERGWRQLVALTGVLAAGAAYVPLGPQWPDERHRQVVARSGARYLLTDDPARPAAWAEGLTILPIDQGPTDAGALVGPPAPVQIDPESLAYVIFTSGTTGEPKGVMIRHASAANTIADLNDRFAVGPADRVLALSEVTFDLSVYDVFGPLAVGGTVVVPDPEHVRDAARLHDLLESTQVTIWNSVPAYLGLLVNYRATAPRPALPQLRLAMVSGDWVPVPMCRALMADLPQVQLVSLGGATEASIWSNWFPVPDPLPGEWASIPYGYPLANQCFRVLDEALTDRPDWVSGELYIGGRGLADGYLNDPEQTAGSFFPHPRDGMPLYRTGDRARYWTDGTLEFLGRQDDQVKVNGFRVELGEIDAALSAQPGVRAAATVLRRDDRGGTLVAHVVADSTETGIAERLIAALRTRLPDYLVPRHVICHDRLPLTANGKVDRARLSQLSLGTTTSLATLPGTAAEERLLTLWRAIVPVDGVTDDFFAAGGHSLAAAALMNAVEREFGVRLPLAALYERRTVRDLGPLLAQGLPAGPALVRMGGSGAPLVLVHPVGGDVLCYQPLVDGLVTTAAVYGISADPCPDPGRSVPDIARDYVELIGELFAVEPVRLVGWSFGAVVAYEMAQHVVSSGRQCRLVMLDPWLPAQSGAAVPEPTLIESFFYNLSLGRVDVHSGGTIAGGAVTSTAQALRDGLARVTAREPRLGRLTVDTVAEMFGRYAGNLAPLLRYEFRDHAGVGPTVVTAEQGLGSGGAQYLMPLRSAIGPGALGGAVWQSVAGDHFSMVDPRRADELVAIVREGLQR
jgi:amino acid adenylation domain-containing protein